MRDVHLAKLAEVAAVGVDHGGRVVIDARQVFFVNRHDQHDLVLPGELGHQLGRGTVGHALGQLVPPRLLLGAKVGTVKQLLQADDLRPLLGGLGDQGDVLVDHRFLDGGDRRCGRLAERGLDQAASNDAGHDSSLRMRAFDMFTILHGSCTHCQSGRRGNGRFPWLGPTCGGLVDVKMPIEPLSTENRR